jgi:hypothetical protein
LLSNELNFRRDETNKDYKNFSFSFGGINFIGLDFVSRDHVPVGYGVNPEAVALKEECATPVPTGTTCPQLIKKEQENLNWLKEKLEEFKGEPTIIFSHHPFVKNFVDAFDSDEINKLEELIKNEKVFANFGGHIHGFYPRPIVGGDYFMDVNEEKYESIGETQVVTTEAIMVGSNEKDDYLKKHDKGIIKIVKILGENKIDYKTNEGKYKPETGEGKEFIALNPYMASDYKSLSGEPCMIFKGHAYTKREHSLFWEIDGNVIGSGEKVEYCFTEVPKTYEVKLTAIDKEKPEIKESLAQKIRVTAGVIPKLLKGIKETIEAISTTLGEKLTEFGRTVKDTIFIRVKHSEPQPVGIITVHFEQAIKDIDLSNMKADIDLNTKKSILYMPEWPNVIEKEKILFIPK